MASWRLALMIAMALLACASSRAFPEYQAFVREHSGQPVNCAMCHAHPDGPSGSEPGQLGRFTPEELIRVNQARAAQPGQQVNSPLLNAFGNRIVTAAGAAAITQWRKEPARLTKALGTKSDLDGDGIADAREYLDGTNPLDRFHGHPGRLFVQNLLRYKAKLFVAGLIAGLLLFGLMNLLRGTARTVKR